ncbi:protein jagged-1b-like [Micropterus salmoides]|nr:protein jagged-1b-like [Micropterus salmoides]
MDLVSKRSANSTIISAIAEVRIQKRQSHDANADHLMPLLVSAVIVVWVLAIASMLLWCVRRRRKQSTHAGVSAQASSLASVVEDNNTLHNSVSTAREQLNHIKNPIVKNPGIHHHQHHHLLLLHHHLCEDKNSVNARIRKSDTGSQSDEDEMDKRLQKARFARAPQSYSLVDWEEPPPHHTTGKPPHWTSKQDNRQLQSQSVNRTEYIV